MLQIFFGEMPAAIYNTEVYFQNVYEDEWITDDFAREVIRKVDKSEVLDKQAIQSPVFGIISPERLSGGTKTLLLMKNMPDQIFNASTCGDNCAPFILKLARERDLTINLYHLMNFVKRSFKAKILNDGVTVVNMEELLFEACKYV